MSRRALKPVAAASRWALSAVFAVAAIAVLSAAFAPSSVLAQGQRATKDAVVQNAWVRKAPGVDTAAVYFVLKNAGTSPLTLVGASSPLAQHVMIHESTTVDGQSRMRMRDAVDVAAGQRVAFEPGGLHVMIHGLSKDLAVGDKLPLTLQLKDGTEIAVSAVVRPLDAN